MAYQNGYYEEEHDTADNLNHLDRDNINRIQEDIRRGKAVNPWERALIETSTLANNEE
jgi:hypothetical protein